MRQKDLSYQDKLNELRLDISHPNSTGINFILVEGGSDIRLFRKFFDLEKCKVESIPGGTENVKRAVETLLPIYRRIVGIRDADFIKLNQTEFNHSNVFLTDAHDIEMTMISHEPVLHALLFEYTGKPQKEHLEIRNKIIDTMSLLSCLKWLNDKERLKLKFKKVGFQDLFSFDNNWHFDIEQYISRILSPTKSPNAVITSPQVLLRKIELLNQSQPNRLQLTNGHDLIKALAAYFSKKEERYTKDKDIEAALRMVYSKEAFSTTALYQSLKNWEQRNSSKIF